MKEMLQNGVPGTTFLFESKDLTLTTNDDKECCIIYCYENFSAFDFMWKGHIPANVGHVVVYTNSDYLPKKGSVGLLRRCDGLRTLDLTPISQQVAVIQGDFLEGCKELTMLDLSPLSQVTDIHMRFLSGCAGLTTQICITRCTSLLRDKRAPNISPLSHITEIDEDMAFLQGCNGLIGIQHSDDVQYCRWCQPPSIL